MSTPPKSARSKDPIEIRRERGEIACAECRRHKLKCNKVIPCSSCMRKGCEAICPNGTLPYGLGTQRGSWDTINDVQMDKLVQMSERIQTLEDALQMPHSSVTPHPFLSEELLPIRNFVERPPGVKKDCCTPEEELIGRLRMLGYGTELYRDKDNAIIDHFGPWDSTHMKLSTTTASNLGQAFPFPPLSNEMQEIQIQIKERLPYIERVSALIEAYLENISWLIKIVDRDQITEELVPNVYQKRRAEKNHEDVAVTATDPHTLSLLLAVFALGAAGDLTKSPWNEEAYLYNNLAWAAFKLRPISDGPSLHTMQALVLLTSYNLFCCRKDSLEETRKLIDLCMSLASSIQLNRDPAHFNLSPKIVQLRRRVFWELYSLDAWRSIDSGRPTVFASSTIDCELPEDREAMISGDDRHMPSICMIRYRFFKEVVVDMVDKLGSDGELKYSEILSYEKRIRDFDPNHLTSLAINVSLDQDGTIRRVLSRFLLVLLKDATLLLLHRDFFLRALIENPTDPMQCQFAPSFSSTYRSAVTILRVFRELMENFSDLLVRIWPVWNQVLLASIMLGLVAACGTSSAFAPQAYAEFELAIDILTKAQMHPIIKDLLPVLLRLRDRALQALKRHGSKVYRPPLVMRTHEDEDEKDDRKEFNSISGWGRTLRWGHFNNSCPSISSLMEVSFAPSAAPSSADVVPSGMPETVYDAQNYFSQLMWQSAIAMGSSPELFRLSPQPVDSQTTSRGLHSGETGTLPLSPNLGMDLGPDISLENWPANALQGSHGHSTVYGTNTGSVVSTDSADFNLY